MLNSISVNSSASKFVHVTGISDGVKCARTARACAWLVAIVLVATLAPAFAQVTLTASSPVPFAVEPGSNATSNLTVDSSPSGADVTLSCAVTPVQSVGTPVCTPSPLTVIAPAMPTLNITTSGTTPAALYTMTITAVGPSNTVTVPVNLSVLAVTSDYTLTVTTPVTPSSVTAGSGATAIITVTSLNGYSGAVTLSCSAISPAVEFGPTCSFTTATGAVGPVIVPSNGTQTGTLNISTIGTTTTTTTSISRPNPHSRILYALWLPLPGLALVALGCGRKKLLALLAPCVLALALLLLPACSSSKSSSSTTNTTGITPNNSYTLTITGADSNSLAPSNGAQSVSLTVTGGAS